jgi:hypothetical protein
MAPRWFLNLLLVPLCNQDSLSGVPGESSPSIGSTGPLVPGGYAPNKLGVPSPGDKEVKTPTPNPAHEPPEIL